MQPTLVTDEMSYWRVLPHVRLRKVIKCYWVVEGKTVKQVVHAHQDDLLLPDGLSELVFNRSGVAFSRWSFGNSDPSQRMQHSYIIGGRSCSACTRAPNPLRLAGVKMDSRFLRQLINTPLHLFQDEPLLLQDLGNTSLLELEDVVGTATAISSIVELFDTFFLRTMRNVEFHVEAADSLHDALSRKAGDVSIVQWARNHHVNVKTLERKFHDMTGMLPKHYARILRFVRAYQTLLSNGTMDKSFRLPEGFYDQSHFVKEFRFFAGVSPSVWRSGSMPTGTIVNDHLLREDG